VAAADVELANRDVWLAEGTVLSEGVTVVGPADDVATGADVEEAGAGAVDVSGDDVPIVERCSSPSSLTVIVR
jgi:hypothetical protein